MSLKQKIKNNKDTILIWAFYIVLIVLAAVGGWGFLDVINELRYSTPVYSGSDDYDISYCKQQIEDIKATMEIMNSTIYNISEEPGLR